MVDKISCIAEFRARSGRQQELKAALSALLGPTRSEAGCIRYELHEDKTDDHHFFMLELFADENAFAVHSAKPYLQDFLACADDLAESVSVTACQPAAE